MSQNPKKFKSKYPLKLSDEKRAFVVIALTNKLSLAGKAAAANALAHYDSRKGYAYASIKTMTRETGYAPSSTKTLSRGLTEIDEIGAFKVKRTEGGAKNTHHACPNMAWFKAEYEQLRKSGRVDDDEFADIRDHDQEEDNSGSQPGMKNSGSGPDNSGSGPDNWGSGPDNSGFQPNDSGSEPDEEGHRKKVYEENQEKRTNRKGSSASRREGPVDDHVSGPPESDSVAGNDNDAERLPEYRRAALKVWNVLQKAPVKEYEEFVRLFVELVQAKEITSSQDVITGLRAYQDCTELKYQMNPVKLLKTRKWKEYRPAKMKLRRTVAI